MTALLEQFYNQSGFPYMNIGSQKYILPEVMGYSDLGLAIDKAEFDKVACGIAQALDSGINTIVNLPKSKIAEYGYPLESINLISQTSTNNLSLMRLSFVINREDNLPVLIEVNSQTPSLNYELESGTQLMQKLSLKLPQISVEHLTNCLSNQLYNLANQLGKPLEQCNIGLLTCDSPEDIYQMNYYKNLIIEQNLGKSAEVVTNLNFGFDSEGYCCGSLTNSRYDILFNWYPLEWAVKESFGSGESFARLLDNAINSNRVAIFNGVESFVVQNKNYLVFMQAEDLWPKNVQNHVSDSYYTESELLTTQSSNCNWIAKPIWGRHGTGVFGSVDFRKFWGDLSDEYYNNQDCIYQPLWTSKLFGNQKATLEVFVYKVSNQWEAGGMGLRLSPDIITNASASCQMVA